MHSTCDVLDGVFVHFLGVGPPTDDEWQAAIDLVIRRGSQLRCGLIVSEGGSPSARQRKLVVETAWQLRAPSSRSRLDVAACARRRNGAETAWLQVSLIVIAHSAPS
jgi:hypothetical protein